MRSFLCALGIACATVFVTAGTGASATLDGGIVQDVTPPQLTGLTLSATSVDVTAASAVIHVNATITDDLSGVKSAFVNFSQGNGGIFIGGQLQPTTGDHYELDVTFPAGLASGSYGISFNLQDNTSNQRFLQPADVAAAGFPSSVTVHGVADTAGPDISGLTLTPASVDASDSDVTVHADAVITDAGSGVSNCVFPHLCSAVFRFGPGNGGSSGFNLVHTTGDHYEADITIPRYARGPAWRLMFLLYDNAGNQRQVSADDLAAKGLPAQIEVTTRTPDATPPSIVALAVSPTSVDVTGGPETVHVDATITDDLSGVPPFGVFISMVSPSFIQFASATFFHTTGDHYEADVTIPRFAEAGLWQFFLDARDTAENDGFHSATDLAAAGLPSTLGVSKELANDVVPPGGSSTTDVEHNGATASQPVEATITTPSGGTVTLQESFTTTPAPTGYFLLGQQINITAPTETPDAPLRLVFELDKSVIPVGHSAADVAVLRDGAVIAECPGLTTATPDPCITSRSTLPNGNVKIAINTSHASAWNFGFRTVPADTTPPAITPHVEGPLGDNGWYTGDVTVTWQVTDAESPVASRTGCDETAVKTDTSGTTFTCSATSAGGRSEQSVTIKRDATAPNATCAATPATLWPPNGKFVPVSVAVTVGDATSGPGGFTLVGMPTDSLGFEIDTADVSGKLLAQRPGNGGDRIYELQYRVRDAAGNTAPCVAKVVVPHDQGK